MHAIPAAGSFLNTVCDAYGANSAKRELVLGVWAMWKFFEFLHFAHRCAVPLLFPENWSRNRSYQHRAIMPVSTLQLCYKKAARHDAQRFPRQTHASSHLRTRRSVGRPHVSGRICARSSKLCHMWSLTAWHGPSPVPAVTNSWMVLSDADTTHQDSSRISLLSWYGPQPLMPARSLRRHRTPVITGLAERDGVLPDNPSKLSYCGDTCRLPAPVRPCCQGKLEKS